MVMSMTQQFLVIIVSDKVKLAQCFSYEYREYNYMKDKEGEPIFFNEKKDGINWINANIKNEHNYYFESSVNKFLKTDNDTVEVPLSLLKHAIRDMFILQAVHPDLDYDYVDGIRPLQVANANSRIRNGDMADGYYQLCDLAGVPYARE
jgi:hypothetical protein